MAIPWHLTNHRHHYNCTYCCSVPSSLTSLYLSSLFLFLFFCLLPQLLTLSSRYPLNSTLLRVCVCSSLSVATFTALHRVLPFLLRYPTQPSTCSLNGARVSNTLKDVFERNQKKRMLGLSQFLMGFTCKHTELLRTNA